MKPGVLCPTPVKMLGLSFLFIQSFLSLTASQPSISDVSFPGETVHCLLRYSFLTFLPFSWPILNIPQFKGRPGCCLPHFRFPWLHERPEPEAPNRASRRAWQAKI